MARAPRRGAQSKGRPRLLKIVVFQIVAYNPNLFALLTGHRAWMLLHPVLKEIAEAPFKGRSLSALIHCFDSTLLFLK
jgi:hypothetical protein